MTFDQSTRNRLARFVGEARALLSEEFTRQLQLDYRMDPASGEVSPEASLAQLDDARRETARLLRETAEHYLPGFPGQAPKARKETLDRIVREQAFTVLNRLCALRMAEARGLLLESVGGGFQSKGFQLYARVAGPALGETGDAYRWYLFSVFDELAVDLPVLFDPFSPQGRLFPREATLLELISLINAPEIAPLWAEDETIGWIYQYFNSKDERKKMRDESAAPRNSRELAVRNQFFTPRYVVEFLADNTLGRTWYEMTQGRTGLVDSCRYLVRRPVEIFLAPGEEPLSEQPGAEDLAQEELLRQPVYIPYRAPKDPRSILMLDPACGSMHFGLYAFDLFERIYAEAWELEAEHGPAALERPRLDPPLLESYPDKESLLRDVPRLIVERNIHGVDIDPRAVQIAGLSLWLRAQKSWREQGLKPQDRPQIRRSNVVCAEPMPGDRALLEEFIGRQLAATAEDRVVAGMLRRVFAAMALAGEAGSLLKIEDEIAAIVAEAEQQWLAEAGPKQDSMFAAPTQSQLDISRIADRSFWIQAEERIYAALNAYASQAENGEGYRRRLFANDAARGFAFIDLCRRRYDVVLMNPPFGRVVESNRNYLSEEYKNTWTDYYNIFIDRALKILQNNGAIGAIIPNRLLETKKSLFIRRKMIEESLLRMFINLGREVMDDAAVDAMTIVVSVMKNKPKEELIPASNILMTESDKRDELLMNWTKKVDSFVKKSDVLKNPNYSMNIDTPLHILNIWKTDTSLEPGIARVVTGGKTFADFRFLRTRWEIPLKEINKIWFSVETGGDYQPFISPSNFVQNWYKDGEEIRINAIGRYGTDAQVKQSITYWFKEGISYPYTSSIGFGPRIFPAGTILSTDAVGVFPYDKEKILAILAILSSSWTSDVLSIFGSSRKTENSSVKSLPILLDKIDLEMINIVISKSINLTMILESSRENSPYFIKPITASASENIFLAYQSFLYSIDDLSRDAYSVSPEVSARIDISKNIDKFAQPISQEQFITNELAFIIGCIFGRWDIRYATGERVVPELPDPFAPLPVCPPGMLQNERGLPAEPADVPASYPLRISWSGILTDDEGHPEDIVGRAREAIGVIWGGRADAIEQEAVAILGVKTLRDYFRKPANFFADHLARYSKSRRQAPIYWPLSTPSGAYTLWLYYHRLTDQTLYTCVNDFVEPKLRQVAEQAAALRQRAGRSAKDEKELERLTELERELRDFRDELLRVAAFWKPDLNDGVQITAAPLWRLFQLKPWQKKLKETWASLEAGDYDWAHLAYATWPERVREKCRSDRSLAIAHDLERLYVAPPAAGKKRGAKKQAVQEEMIDED